jgi:hypothetical protein
MMFFSESLIRERLQSRMWQRRNGWKKRKKSLDVTIAATLLTTVSVCARTAAKLLIAAAALATAEQQADKTSFFAHCYSVVKRNGN